MTTPTTSVPTAPAASLPLAPGRWELDAAHSAVEFTVRHLGISKVRGRFSAFDVEVAVGESAESTSVVATVDLASIDTGNADRDAHCRQPDILDVARRPTMAFRSRSVFGSGDEWTLAGDLTIGEVTRPFHLAVVLGGVETFPLDGRRHAGFEATGELRRSEFGIAPELPAAVLGDVVKVHLDVQLMEPADPDDARR